MGKWASLTVGSLAGGFARYLLATRIYAGFGAGFPYGTLAVNLSACFLIGIFDSWAETRFLLGPEARMLLMTGFCGAYSTFSTLILETSHLLRDGQLLLAGLNFFGSGLLGLLVFRFGAYLGGL